MATRDLREWFSYHELARCPGRWLEPRAVEMIRQRVAVVVLRRLDSAAANVLRFAAPSGPLMRIWCYRGLAAKLYNGVKVVESEAHCPFRFIGQGWGANDTSGELRPPVARLIDIAVPSLRTLAE